MQKKTITVHDTYFFTESYYKRGTNEEETNRQSNTDKDLKLPNHTQLQDRN